jgi:hypothetical protein
MTQLEHLIDAPYKCGREDVNMMAFAGAAVIIGGCDTVEEFIACSIWPLNEGWEFEVEMKESPLLMVVVPMPKVSAIIGKQEMGAAFKTWITAVSNQLVGNYSAIEHNVCATQLQHGQLNRVIELEGMNYQPRPEPIVCATKKHQVTVVVVQLPPSKKTDEGKKQKKALSHSGDTTSEQENMLAKPIKASKKFSMQKAEVVFKTQY